MKCPAHRRILISINFGDWEDSDGEESEMNECAAVKIERYLI